MLVNTGGGNAAHGPSEGIHWHMNIGSQIEYVARDRRRMEIPWVKATATDGTVTVYIDPTNPLTEEELSTLEHRRMDCMDCHNRPSHVYLSPEEAADLSLQTGALDASIPWIKEAAVGALAGEYKGQLEADAGIETFLRDFYAKKDPDLAGETEPKIPAIAEELRRAYHKNFFPEMRADWSAYPNQIGHRLYPGCFRCHDERHKSESGKVIEKKCSGPCHSFLEGAANGELSITTQGTYAHPFKSPVHFEKMECWTCHTGKASPYGTCAKCHEFEADVPMAFACSGCHKTTKEKVENVDCRDCHDPAQSKLHAVKEHQDCLACHIEHDWNQLEYPDSCSSGDCHESLEKPHHDDQPCVPCHKEFKGEKGFRMVLAGRSAAVTQVTPVAAPAAE